jgi:hypothetical protein
MKTSRGGAKRMWSEQSSAVPPGLGYFLQSYPGRPACENRARWASWATFVPPSGRPGSKTQIRIGIRQPQQREYRYIARGSEHPFDIDDTQSKMVDFTNLNHRVGPLEICVAASLGPEWVTNRPHPASGSNLPGLRAENVPSGPFLSSFLRLRRRESQSTERPAGCH